MRLSKSLRSTLLCVLSVAGFVGLWKLTLSNKALGSQNAALVAMVQQRDLYNVVDMLRNVEDRFNHKFHYDWVLLSENNFSDQFKDVSKRFVSGKIHYRTINRKQHWNIPPNIDRNKLLEEMQKLDLNGVPDGGSNTFRIMSNFLANAFLEYLPEFRYAAFVDMNLKLYCDTDDFFAEMKAQKAKMGFTLSNTATPHSVNDLSEVCNDFMTQNKDLVSKNQWVNSFVEPWSGFCEFAPALSAWDLNFFRSQAYQKWYEHISESAGIFYRRWSAQSIHTLAAAMFLEPQEVIYLQNVGLYIGGRVNCPTSQQDRLDNACSCPFDPKIRKDERNNIFTYRVGSCAPKFMHLRGTPFQDDWEKYSDREIYEQFF